MPKTFRTDFELSFLWSADSPWDADIVTNVTWVGGRNRCLQPWLWMGWDLAPCDFADGLHANGDTFRLLARSQSERLTFTSAAVGSPQE
jgi:hypothetical protein